MSKHLLACECGQQLEVDTGQAGESISCTCGRTIAVPTLRQLRQLPPVIATPDATSVAAERAWGVRQGTIAASLIVAVLCLIVAGYSRYSQPELPRFDAGVRTQVVDRSLEQMTPVAAWQLWVDTYRPLATRGLQEFRHPAMDALEQEIRWHQLVQMAMVGVAAIALLVAGVLGFWPSG